jgi:hypothetical protein
LVFRALLIAKTTIPTERWPQRQVDRPEWVGTIALDFLSRQYQ